MPFDLSELGVADLGGGEKRRFALDRTPCLKQLKRADVGDSGMPGMRSARYDIDARAGADFDLSVQLQREDCLADGWAGDRIGLGEFALRGQALSHWVGARRDLRCEIACDTFVKPAGFRFCHPLRLSGHAGASKVDSNARPDRLGQIGCYWSVQSIEMVPISRRKTGASNHGWRGHRENLEANSACAFGRLHFE